LDGLNGCIQPSCVNAILPRDADHPRFGAEQQLSLARHVQYPHLSWHRTIRHYETPGRKLDSVKADQPIIRAQPEEAIASLRNRVN
jgi:hypothetical protein